MKRFLSLAGATALMASAAIVAVNAPIHAEAPYQITSVQKGKFTFNPSAKDFADGSVFEDDCPGKVCTCTADIEKVKFIGTDPVTVKINQSLEKSVAPVCDVTTAQTENKPRVTYVSDQLASVVTDKLVMGLGAGGGCHGSTQAVTYDRSNGAALLLKDVVAPKDLPQVLKSIAKEITDNQRKISPELFTEQVEINNKVMETKGNLGLFVQAGKIMVQVDQFLFSCADGHSFPATLPPQYIRNDKLRAVVGKSL